MPGWTKDKRKVVEEGFYAYLNRAKLFSKDFSGEIILGQHLYDGQVRFITETFDALEQDIHKIYVLKSRQLGLSTIARALTSFLLGFHNGLKGVCVFDTSENRAESRAELEALIDHLPRGLKFPVIQTRNRSGITLANNSKILFLSAGVKKTKTSGTLGRSLGVSLAHLSELCSYDNDEGLEAFENSLSDANPDRLYIYESTARGYNTWNTTWEEARKDPAHCKCIFLGWWSKPSQSIPRDSADFQLYGLFPPSDKEQVKIRTVLEKYGHQITPEQLAWIRRKMNPTAVAGDAGDADPEFEGSNARIQEQPWTEDEAFQQTGATFFSPEVLTDQTNKFVSNKFKNYMFHAGEEFINMRAYKARTIRESELKVWEEPEVGGCYVIAVDPAYGENEKNDRSSIQILRCYADGLDQVAEYSSPLITTRHLAWVLAALLGWYGEGTNEVRYIMELMGPGNQVFQSLKDLQVYLRIGHQMREVHERGLTDIFKNVQTYIYTRPDSMGAGHNYHWVSSSTRKVMIFEALRDYVSNGTFRIRSAELIKEMNSIARDGDSIEAPGSKKDDKVVAAAMGVQYWLERVKTSLMARKMTREAEAAKKMMSIKDQVQLFNQNHLDMFFSQKRTQRYKQQALMRRATWRHQPRAAKWR
jgi:hypothetical protein